MQTLILITTYNRQGYLTELLPLLKDHEVHVWDDGSEQPLRRVPSHVSYRWVPHHGRENYGQLIRRAFKRASSMAHDRVLLMPDDVLPAPPPPSRFGGSVSLGVADVFERMESIWQEVRAADPYALCLNPIIDKRGVIGQWRSNHPVRVTRNAWMTGWNDLFMYGPLHPLAEIISRQTFQPPAPVHFGSGIGSQVSRRIRKEGNLYQVAESLWIHRDGPSVMCPEHRKEVPL